MSTNLTTTPTDDLAVTAGLGVMVLEAVGLTMPPPPRRRGPSEEFRQRIAELARDAGTTQQESPE
jgi:hypothetical protein